jgi:hypothetical protein
MNKPVNPWLAAIAVLLVLGVATFLYLRPEPRTEGPPGMPPDVAAEFGRRMQQRPPGNTGKPARGPREEAPAPAAR